MEDTEIVQLYWDRDQKAITETAAKYSSYCTSIAKNILGNQEDGRLDRLIADNKNRSCCNGEGNSRSGSSFL